MGRPGFHVVPTIKPKNLKPGMVIIRPGRNIETAPLAAWEVISIAKKNVADNGYRVRPFYDITYRSDERTSLGVHGCWSDSRFALIPDSYTPVWPDVQNG